MVTAARHNLRHPKNQAADGHRASILTRDRRRVDGKAVNITRDIRETLCSFRTPIIQMKAVNITRDFRETLCSIFRTPIIQIMMMITDGRVVIGTMITMIATATIMIMTGTIMIMTETIMIMTGTVIAIEITKAGEA